MPQSSQSAMERGYTASTRGDTIAKTDNHSAPMEAGTTPNHRVGPRAGADNPLSSVKPLKAATQSTPNALPLSESLDIFGLAILFGGSLLILVAIAMLTLLWLGGGLSPEAGNALSTWRNLVLRGWTPQSITLVSLTIRTTVTAQAAVCTSMLAGILIEKHFVPRTQVAQLSILRGINDGPMSLMRLLISSRCFKLFTRVDSLIMYILLLGGIALQFSSTLLLLDVQSTSVTSSTSPLLTQSLYDPAQELRSSTAHLYMKQQPVFAAFGESRTNSLVAPDAYGFSDTGLIEQAFLPFRSPTDRMSLRYYEGQASIFKSRYQTDFWGEWEDYVASLMASSKQPPYDSAECPPLSFRCEVPGAADGSGWQSSLCLVTGVCGSLKSGDKGPEVGVVDPWSVNSTIYLWQSIDESGTTKEHPVIVEATADQGEWRSYVVAPNLFVNVSLCFHDFNVDHTHVNMKALGIITEPQVTYSPQNGAPDTSVVRAHLGADSSQSEYGERVILQLTRQSVPLGANSTTDQDEDRSLARNYTISQLQSLIRAELIGGLEANIMIVICGYCVSAGEILHEETVSVLEDIINFTGRAADVIQTYVSIISSSIYYDFQKTFITSEEPQVSLVHTVLTANNCKRRNGCAGFSSVMALLLVHMTCVGVITVLYVRQTRFSRYGNIWHAVSQLSSAELSDTVETSKHQADKVVVAGMVKEGKVYMLKVGRSPSTNKVEILRQG
ncbi:hypothetical protein F4782DRAFT_539171 [Xylaria castorea]|nr:hypothetical protein F4782DRAFT_539171 [Xylaria castorea]